MRRRVSNILVARGPDKMKIKFGKKHRPASLASIENMRSHEIFKVFVVRDD